MEETPRARIGPYELTLPPRVGGMGEVYRAWDPRLKREVALKILPRDVAEDPGRRHRLLEEAQAAGGLNHPNIVAVYDVGVDAGRLFIVSEYIHGKELRDEIDRGAVPTRRLLELATQLAAGLRAAHDAGIVHRDLKPANVMVTRDGRVKIVDFGLAKAFAATPPGAAGHDAMTVTLPGTVTGTPQYMSPEQARGGEVDFRTDQFSLGLMLYEMATGAHPFRRNSSPQTMAAIIGDEARPITELNTKVPTLLRWIIERCLAKDPADRYASTADLLKDFTTLQGRLGELTSEENQSTPTRSRSRLGIGIGVAGALMFIAALGLAFAPRQPPSRLQFDPLVTDASFQGGPAWSADAKALAYVSSVDGVLQVFTRSLAAAVPQQLTRTGFDSTDPFWSPDNTRIYYHSLAEEAESLWSISATGGPAQLVAKNAGHATISTDARTLVFFREEALAKGSFGLQRAIWLASPAGTDARRYKEPPFDTRTFVDGVVRFSPDGSKLLAWVWGWADQTGVPSAEFWIMPWPTGKPYRVLEPLGQAAVPASISFDWLPDNRQVVIALWDQLTTGTHLWIADTETGSSRPLTVTPGSENWPDVTPDGRRVAFASEAIDFDVNEIPLDGSAARTLIGTSRNELEPAFRKDGSQYAYVSDKDGALRIWTRSRAGQFERPVTGPEQFPGEATLALGSLSLSPDGDRIAYQRYGEKTGYQIWVSTVAAAGPPVQVAPGEFYQDGPSWSPDGAWVAFLMRSKDLTSALVKARVGTGAPPEIIIDDVPTLSLRPLWSPDGRWILFDSAQGVVIVSPDGKQKKAISEEFWMAATWAADGRHIYVLREADRFRHYALTSVDIETGVERTINPDLGVIPHASQPIRGLTLSGPGTLATSVASARSDIWVVEGFANPRSLFERLFSWR